MLAVREKIKGRNDTGRHGVVNPRRCEYGLNLIVAECSRARTLLAVRMLSAFPRKTQTPVAETNQRKTQMLRKKTTAACRGTQTPRNTVTLRAQTPALIANICIEFIRSPNARRRKCYTYLANACLFE